MAMERAVFRLTGKMPIVDLSIRKLKNP